MKTFKEALSTSADNKAFEQEVLEWLRMGSELRRSYVANLLSLLSEDTRVTVVSEENGVRVDVSMSLALEEVDFESLCRKKTTVGFKVYRKGRDKLTLERLGNRFVVTSL